MPSLVDLADHALFRTLNSSLNSSLSSLPSRVELADHPAIVFPAYIAALLPLTVLYALDFITEKWRTVGDTRHTGHIYLWSSIPPLCFVVFYIHLQHVKKNYQEMAAAMSAAIFCMFHILRTLWGLVQLDAFKEWNMRALRCLNIMGYEAPVYELVGKERDGNNVDRNEPGREPETCTRIVQSCFGKVKKLALTACNYLVSRIRRKYSPKEYMELNLSEEQLGITVDHHMLVNSSLVDNEFTGAELPCRLKKACFLKAIWALVTRGRKFRVSDHVECEMAVECSVRWLVVFLARFGSEWLMEKSDLEGLDEYDYLPFDEQKNVFRRLVGALAVMKTTFENRGDETSLLCPGSPLLKTLSTEEGLRLTVSERGGLPYMCSGYGDEEIRFQNFSSSVHEVILGWDRRAKSILRSDERKAVEEMSSLQISFFAKMMSSKLSELNRQTAGWQKLRIKEQIGDFDAADKKTFRSLVPTHTLFYSLELWRGRFQNARVDQACVHVDNWAALESGRRVKRIVSAEDISDALGESDKGTFDGHKTLEMRAYELDLSQDRALGTRAAWGIVFLGSVMESVRAFLAHSVAGLSAAHIGGINWTPKMDKKAFRFQCSSQLRNCVRESQNGSSGTATGDEEGPRAWNIETRLLWELQLNFHTAVSTQADENGGCRGLAAMSEMIVLCILGFPCLEVTKEPRDFEENGPTELQESMCGIGTVLSMCSDDDNYGCDTERVYYSVKPVQGPQPIWLIVSVDRKTGTGEVKVISSDNGTTSNMFDWQAWKDSFMGRVQGQAEWREKMVGSERLRPREEALESVLSTPIKQLPRDVKQWGGWPPLHPRLSMISAKGTFYESSLDYDFVEEAMDDAERESRARAEAGDTVIAAGGETAGTLRAEAQTAKQDGRSSKSLELLCKCIEDHNDPAALDEVLALLRENGGDFLDKHLSMINHCMRNVLESTIESRRKRSAGREGAESATILLEKLSLCASALHEMSPEDVEVPVYHMRCLFELRDPKFLPILQEYRAEMIFSGYTHLHAAIFCFDQWKSSGESYLRLVGEAHLETYSLDCQFSDDALTIGYLFEKGILRGRQTVHLKPLLPQVHTPSLSVEETACHFVGHSPDSVDAVRKSTATAVRIYEYCITRNVNVGNRLGLIHLLDNEGFQDLERSEALFNWAKTWDSKDAMCNLAVLHGLHYGEWGLAEQNLTRSLTDTNSFSDSDSFVTSHQFEQPTPKNVCINANEYKIWDKSDICRDPHTSSMNNLAVLYEMESNSFGDAEKALELYERILEIDENPVAVLNMIVLLKMGPATVQDEARSERLLRTLQSRLPDNDHMPVWAKSIVQLGACGSGGARQTWSVGVEELDNCAVFVKQLDEQS